MTRQFKEHTVNNKTKQYDQLSLIAYSSVQQCALLTVHRVLCRLDDIAEDRTPPGPGVVRDNVGRIGDEWSVVCVELTRLVRRTVVVRVTDR